MLMLTLSFLAALGNGLVSVLEDDIRRQAEAEAAAAGPEVGNEGHPNERQLLFRNSENSKKKNLNEAGLLKGKSPINAHANGAREYENVGSNQMNEFGTDIVAKDDYLIETRSHKNCLVFERNFGLKGKSLAQKVNNVFLALHLLTFTFASIIFILIIAS